MIEKKDIKRRSRWRILGELVILFGLIAWLLFNINDYVNTPMIKGAIFKGINRTFYGRLYAGPLKIDLRKFEAHGWGVGVVDMHGRHLAFSPEVRVRFNRLSFFWRRMRLEEVELKNPVVRMWTDPDHVFVWRKFKRPPRKQFPIFRWRAGEVIVHHGKFTYDYYPEPKVHVHLEGINARAKFNEKTPFIQGTIERLHINYNEGSFDGWFENVVLRGTQDKEFVRVNFLYARYLNMPVFINGYLWGFTSKDPAMDFHINLLEDENGEKPKIANLLRHFNYTEDPPGDFTLTAHVSGRSSDYKVEGEFKSSWGKIEGQEYHDFRAKYVYHDSWINVSGFSMRIYGMRFEGSGRYNIYDGRFHFQGAMTHRGRVMRYDIAGTMDTGRNIMQFSKFEVKSKDTTITGDGSWNVSRGTWDMEYNFVMHGMAGELRHWGVEGFRGGLDVHGIFKGTLANPFVTAQGRVSNLEWNRAFIGTGPVSIELEGGIIVAELEAAGRGGKFSGDIRAPLIRNGTIVSLRRNPFSFNVQIQGFKITKQLFDTDFEGLASGKLSGEGTTVNFRGEGEITLKKVDAWSQSVKRVTADLVVTQAGIAFENARITLPSNDKATGRLWIDWDMNYELYVESPLIHLSSLDEVQAEELPLEGTFSFEAAGAGNFELVKINGHADFSTMTYDTLDLGGGELDISLKGTYLSLTGEFFEHVLVCGYYEMDPGLFDDFKITFDGTPLDSIFDWMEIEDAGGFIVGSMTLDGGGETWGDVDFLIEVIDMEIAMKKETIRNQGKVRLEIGPSGGTQDLHLVVSRGRLDVTGTLSPEKEWDLQVLAVVEMESLANLMYTFRRATGVAVFDAHITGKRERLKLDGAFMVDDGAFKFRGYRSEFSDVEVIVLFYPDRIEISNFSGTIDEEGDFSLTGEALYEGMAITGFDISLDADRVTISKPGEYRIVLSPRLSLIGDPDNMVLEGSVEIVEGRYVKDVRIERQVVKLERETAPEAEMPDWMKKLRLNVQIEDAGNFRIRNNLVDVYLTTDLTVSGTLSAFSLDGVIKSHEGEIYYGGMAFDLVRASIDFADPLKIDPEVNVFGRTDIREWEVRLYLEGRMSKMQLRLESSPALGDQAILSLMTFRRLPSELNQNQASALMAIPLLEGGRLVGPVEKFTGISIGKIEAGSNRPGEPISVRIDLSDRVTVEYSTDTTGEDQVRETTAIYKLTDNMWLVGTQNNLGEYSLEVKFRFQFE